MTAEADRSVVGKLRMNEETRSLSPIEEESESTSRLHESFDNFTINEAKRSDCRTMRHPRLEEYQELLERTTEGNSSSEDERMERDRYRLRKVEGSYCCFRASPVSKEAEASGDNDEAETGLGDKSSWKTTVEQLKGRVSQLEREIVGLKRRRRCQGHVRETCEKLWRNLLIWRDDHEKRIDSQIARWQMTERKRIHDEMENTRTLYDGIQRHLDTLVKRSARSRLDFRRQIDVWEKRLKRDVVSLHESNLMELREQFRTWFEVQNAINSSSVRKEIHEVYKPDNEAALGKQNEPYKSDKFEATVTRDDAELLRKIEHIIKFEVQQRRDDLARRMDRKIAELWSAFEDFKHNFHLDRDYVRHDYVEINDDKAESITTEVPSNFFCQKSAKSDLNASSEEKCVP